MRVFARRSLRTVYLLLILAAGISLIVFGLFLRNNNEPSGKIDTMPAAGQADGQAEATLSKTTVDNGLEQKLKDWAANHPGDYGIVVREATGKKRTASYQADKQFLAASTYKPFMIYAVLSWVEQGKLALDAQVVGGNDIIECIDALLIYSAETCGWSLGRLVGWPAVSDYIHGQGFTLTDINNYTGTGGFVGEKVSTAKDQAEFAWRLNAGSLLNAAHTDMLLSRMKRQVWRQRIPAGVPEGTVVADKPGWIYDTENDTAIVYGEKSTYVLAIMSKGSSAKNLAELSELIYQHLSS